MSSFFYDYNYYFTIRNLKELFKKTNIYEKETFN